VERGIIALALVRQGKMPPLATLMAEMKDEMRAAVESRLQWTPLNMTLAEWKTNVGDFVLHEGTVLRTGRGVFAAGIEGTCYVGQKREDGTVDHSTEGDPANRTHPAWVEETEVVIEYARSGSGGQGARGHVARLVRRGRAGGDSPPTPARPRGVPEWPRAACAL
jgi:hypothetical protein